MSNEIQQTQKQKSFFSRLPFTAKLTLTAFVAFLLVMLGALLPTRLAHKETPLSFGFQDVGQLVTQEWYGRILEDSYKDRKIFNTLSVPFTKSRLIFSIDVEVLAGVNFEEISYDYKNEKENGEVLTITLPHAQIYKAYEVANSFKSHLDSESWFTNINSAEQQKLKDAIVEQGKAQALKSGILRKAEKNAEILIKNMVYGNEMAKNLKILFIYK